MAFFFVLFVAWLRFLMLIRLPLLILCRWEGIRICLNGNARSVMLLIDLLMHISLRNLPKISNASLPNTNNSLSWPLDTQIQPKMSGKILFMLCKFRTKILVKGAKRKKLTIICGNQSSLMLPMT